MLSDIIIQKDLFIAKLSLNYIRYWIAQMWPLASRLLFKQVSKVFTDRIKTSSNADTGHLYIVYKLKALGRRVVSGRELHNHTRGHWGEALWKWGGQGPSPPSESWDHSQDFRKSVQLTEFSSLYLLNAMLLSQDTLFLLLIQQALNLTSKYWSPWVDLKM